MRHVILNAKERKLFLAKLHEQFGVIFKLEGNALLRSPRGRYYLAGAQVFSFPFEALRIDTLGLYVASDEVDGIRLSIEGAQVFGPHATHHVLELASAQASEWLLGRNIVLEQPSTFEASYVIVRSGKDYLGTGKIKEGTLLNYVPKSRWINAVHD